MLPDPAWAESDFRILAFARMTGDTLDATLCRSRQSGNPSSDDDSRNTDARPVATGGSQLVKLRLAERVVVAAAVLIAVYAVFVGALIYLKPPPVRFVYRESTLTRTGEMIFRREGCLSCHELFGNGTSYGPALDGVGSRRDVGWLKEYLLSPRPGVGDKPYRLRMPAFDALEAGELDALVNYLGALRELDAEGGIIESDQSRSNAGN